MSITSISNAPSTSQPVGGIKPASTLPGSIMVIYTPGGASCCDQRYVGVSLSGSPDRVPSNITNSSSFTSWSSPAFASGVRFTVSITSDEPAKSLVSFTVKSNVSVTRPSPGISVGTWNVTLPSPSSTKIKLSSPTCAQSYESISSPGSGSYDWVPSNVTRVPSFTTS